MPRCTLSFCLLLGACLARGPEAVAPSPSVPVTVSVASAASVQVTPIEQPFGPPRAPDEPANPLRPAADGALSVRLGALRVEGPQEGPLPGADLEGIAAEVAHNAGYLQRCYEDRLREVPGLEGAIAIHAHITSSGVVSGQCITDDSVADPVLIACVNSLIARGRYPAGRPETVDVTFPFVFTPPSRG
jgi:hypothetical protein